jgi:hypothetical protein
LITNERAEDRGQTTEGRRLKTESRNQKWGLSLKETVPGFFLIEIQPAVIVRRERCIAGVFIPKAVALAGTLEYPHLTELVAPFVFDEDLLEGPVFRFEFHLH